MLRNNYLIDNQRFFRQNERAKFENSAKKKRLLKMN